MGVRCGVNPRGVPPARGSSMLLGSNATMVGATKLHSPKFLSYRIGIAMSKFPCQGLVGVTCSYRGVRPAALLPGSFHSF